MKPALLLFAPMLCCDRYLRRWRRNPLNRLPSLACLKQKLQLSRLLRKRRPGPLSPQLTFPHRPIPTLFVCRAMSNLFFWTSA